LVLLRTAANKVVGRKFIGGLTEAAIGNSLLVAGAVGNLVAYGLAIQAGPTMGVDNGTFEFGIYDKHGVYHAVTSLVVATVLAYQRRRKQGIGI
jgi:Na+/H+ antiporter NhaD/arsenite permease-like protein